MRSPSQSPTLYPALRWGYAPIKLARRSLSRLKWRPRIRRIVAEYLSDPGFKGLHVSTSGIHHHDHWLNAAPFDRPRKAWIDFPHDLTSPLPFPDKSLDAIYANEVIQQVDPRTSEQFLSESRRVLRRGGVLRITTPDLAEICRLYLGQRDDVTLDHFAAVWLDGEFSKDTWLNAQFHLYGHRHLWSYDELCAALIRAGFAAPVRCQPMQTSSSIPQLKQLDKHYGPAAPPWLFARTMVLESENATAPAPQPKPLRHLGRVAAPNWDNVPEESTEDAPAATPRT